MAIQLRNYSTVATGSTSLSINKPTNTADGDIMIMVICVHDTSSKGSLPSGWQRFAETSSTNGTGFFAWKRASSEGTSYSITGLADSSAGFIVSFYNCLSTGDPIETSAGRANASGSFGTAGITTTTADCMILSAACVMDNYALSSWTCATNPTTLTEGADDGSNTGSDTHVGGAHAIRSGSGSTGASSYTHTSFENVGLLCAIKPLEPTLLVVPDSTHSHSAESKTLVENRTLSVAGDTLGVTNDTVAPVEIITLTVADASHIITDAVYSYRYYKLDITANNGHSNTNVSEFNVYATIGGSDQCTGGSYTGNGSNAGSAFDNEWSTWWSSVDGVTGWVEYYWTAVKDILAYGIQAISSSYSTSAPKDWTVQASNDGTNWVTIDTRTNQTGWGHYEERVFVVSGSILLDPSEKTLAVSDSTHEVAAAVPMSKYYRMRVDAIYSGSWCNVAELEIRASVGGSDQCTGGTANSETFGNPSEAFDNSSSSWTNSNGVPFGWFGYYWGTAKRARQYGIQSTSSYPDSTPKSWVFQASDDGSTWVTVDTRTDEPVWTGLEIRYYITDTSISLSQVMALQVQESTHVVTNDTIALSEAQTVAVAESAHAVSSDAPILGVTIELFLSESLHPFSSDAPELIQGFVLSVAECSHAFGSEVPVLTVDSTLEVGDGAHALTNDPIVLIASSSLEVAESSHFHTADVIGLTQQQAIVMPDSAHALTNDSITLSYSSGNASILRIDWTVKPPLGTRLARGKFTKSPMLAINFPLSRQSVTGPYPVEMIYGFTFDTINASYIYENQDGFLPYAANRIRSRETFTGLNGDINNCTFVIQFRRQDTSTNYQTFFEVGTESTSVPFLWVGSSGNDLTTRSQASSSYFATTGDKIADTTIFHTAVLRLDKAASTRTWFLDGILVAGPTSYTSDGAMSGTYYVHLNYTGVWGGYPHYAIYKMLALFNGPLSDAECINLSNNPYQIFEPKKIYLIGAGGKTLSVGDSSHAHTSDAPVLTQQHILAPAEATHAVSSESPILQTAEMLQVSECAHSHTADSITLTQAHTLAIAETSHAVTNDSISLGTSGYAVAHDAYHAVTSDPIALSQSQTLAAADSSHAHTVDPVVLAQVHILAVEESIHSHTADSIALSQGHILSAAEANHSLTNDPITLLYAGALGVNDSVHALTSDPITLMQSHTIGIDDVIHLHTSDGVVLSSQHILTPAGTFHALTNDQVAVSTAGMLGVNECNHAITNDSITLIQSHSVGIADALHSHSAESPSLIVNIILAVHDSTHTTGSDEPVLIRNITLATADSYHDHAADSIYLISDLPLLAEDGLHQITSESPVLTQFHNLTVADSYHTVTSDNAAVVLHGLLEVDDSHHDVYSDNIPLPSDIFRRRSNVIRISEVFATAEIDIDPGTAQIEILASTANIEILAA